MLAISFTYFYRWRSKSRRRYDLYHDLRLDTKISTVITPHAGRMFQSLLIRIRYMHFIHMALHISGLITPPIEAATMSVNVWLPFLVAIGAYIICSSS